MALGIPDKKKGGTGTSLGVQYDNDVPPATITTNPNAGKSSGGGTPPPQFDPSMLPKIPNPFGNNSGLPPVVSGGNGPIFPQDGPTPISYNGGYFNPTTAPFGFDMTAPGEYEQMWKNNQGLWMQTPQLDWVNSLLPQFQDPWTGEQTAQNVMGTIANPGAGQQYWTGIQGSFNNIGNNVTGGYKGPNNASEAYGMTKGMMPGSLQPKFDAYYDRMHDKAMSDVNSQSAARGAYGSNAALNNSIGAGLDVEAQRAKAATDFELANSQNQMGWANLLGNQARGADLSGLGIYGANLQGAQLGLDKARLGGELAFKSEGMDFDKKKALADLAFASDEHKLSRLDAGVSTAFGLNKDYHDILRDAFGFAGGAQDRRERRVNTLYGQNEDFSNDVLGFLGENFDKLLGSDEKTFGSTLQNQIAQVADERGWNQQQQERIFRDAKAAWDIYMGSKANKAAGG